MVKKKLSILLAVPSCHKVAIYNIPISHSGFFYFSTIVRPPAKLQRIFSYFKLF